MGPYCLRDKDQRCRYANIDKSKMLKGGIMERLAVAVKSALAEGNPFGDGPSIQMYFLSRLCGG